eukprot:scaffold3488_cov23-Cyclotella_meneghiniana.AAC.2
MRFYSFSATIGSRSCIGDSIQGTDGGYGYSCAYLQGEQLDFTKLITLSRTLSYVCQNCTEGTVGDDSCYEYAACYQYYNNYYVFKVGKNACRGQGSCMYAGEYLFIISI